MTARAMMNTGLRDLRLVNPRDPWPLGDVHQKRMAAASSGADEILLNARIFSTLEEAIADKATFSREHIRIFRDRDEATL